MSGSAKATTDHEVIRRWVEERGGKPACVKATKGKGAGCLLRIDFPGYSGEDTLEPVSWDEFFEVFENSKLAMLLQDIKGGSESRFNKLVSRETVEAER